MTNGLEALAKMEYPGHIIIIGRDMGREHNIVVYGITEGDPRNRARKLVLSDSGNHVYVRSTDEDVVRAGNPDLLVYPAISFQGSKIAVSNGLQTENIELELGYAGSPAGVLLKALFNWSYEPDLPHFTSRISGCVVNGGAALCIIRRAPDGSAVKNYFEIPLIAGHGKLIATYAGPNVNPLPPFRGEPLDVRLEHATADETARAVYAVLAPQDPAKDFRVGAVAVYLNRQTVERQVAIVNRFDMR